jgi:hypothetical protein
MTHPADIAFTDQAKAAEADLARILDRTAPDVLGHDAYDAAPARWLTARIDAFATAVQDGTVQLCAHLEHATAPLPAFGILGALRLACRACAGDLTPAGDALCDRCGQPADLAEPAIANLGTIALLILQCDPCATTE